MRTTIATIFLTSSLMALVGCFVYHVGFRPEWTQAQALREQWPILLGAVVLAGIGCWLLDR